MLGLDQFVRKPASGVGETVHDTGVAGPAHPQKVVVLADDLVATLGEVEGEGRHIAAEVVDLEDQFLGELIGVAPHHESDTGIGQPVLVPTDVDRRHSRQPEVPFEIGLKEGDDESAAGGVDVHRNIESGVLLECVQRGTDLGDRLEFTGVGGAQNSDHPDGVDVDGLDGLLGGDHVAVLRHRQIPRLDVEVATELFPHHLHVRTHHQVRRAGLPGVLVGTGHPLPPAPLQCQTG